MGVGETAQAKAAWMKAQVTLGYISIGRDSLYLLVEMSSKG